MTIDKRIPAPTKEVWALVNSVSIGARPMEDVIHILSIDEYLILQRSGQRFSPTPDVLFYPVRKEHELGQLAITPDTLIVIDETGISRDGWFGIIREAALPTRLFLDGNDALDENGLKYSGITEITHFLGKVCRMMIQCRGEDINKLLDADRNKKRTIGMLTYSVGEMADRIAGIVGRDNTWR
jgi:hypothetical protein